MTLMLSFITPRRTRAVLALALLSLSLTACSSSRDSARGGDDRIETRLASINEAVALTEAQTVRIRAILTAQAADRPSGPPPQGGGQGQGGQGRGGQGRGGQGGGADRQAEMDRQIEAVLTGDQIEQYRTWRASQAQQRPQGPPPRGQ